MTGSGSRRCAVVTAMLLALSSAARAVHAAPTETEKETARNLMRQGDVAFDASDFPKALSLYEAAHAIMRVPTTGLAVARAQERSGKWVEAREGAREVARSSSQADDPPAFTQARLDAAKLATDLETRIPVLVVRVRGASPNQEIGIAIDGVAMKAVSSGTERRLNPGVHRVSASAAGFRPAVAEVRLGEGEHRDVELTLSPTTPDVAGHAKSANEPASARSGAARPVAFTLLGLGFVGVAVGAVTGILSFRETSALKPRCPDGSCPPDAQGDLDRAGTLATASNVSFIVGGVAAVTGLVVLATLGRSRSKRAGWQSPAGAAAPATVWSRQF